MKSLKKALNIFLDEAYGGQVPPEAIRKLADSVSSVKDFPELVSMDGVEAPAISVASVRLGNRFYPHMKLVIRKEGEGLYFAVDSHDGPDRIPPTLPGYERFRKIIQENERIRETVQRRWAGEFQDADTDDQTQSSKGLILVVDDESFVRDIMSKLFSSFGFEVLAAECADTALDLARNRPISCCFLDIMMPEKSGYQFIEELEAEGLRKFPIVFVTGMHPKHIREDMADGLILKPFTASMLKGQFSRFGLM